MNYEKMEKKEMPKVNLNQKFVNEATCPPEKNRVDYYDTTLIGPLPSPVPRPSPIPWPGPCVWQSSPLRGS